MADGAPPATVFTPDPAAPRAFRDALGRFATGVTVVTAEGPEGPVGLTANSFTSLSMDPPLVLWSIGRASRRYGVFSAAAHYAIHILGAAQADWPARFSRDGAGFAGLSPAPTAEGIPALAGAPVRFDCRTVARQEGGDHLIIVGQVLRVTLEEGEPLVFARGGFGRFTAA
jgi:flavin reductase (DIM6/NTAB) family NADH-FMN oxidoreductase RutF